MQKLMLNKYQIVNNNKIGEGWDSDKVPILFIHMEV